jgi:large subunit ribosomal protein L23
VSAAKKEAAPKAEKAEKAPKAPKATKGKKVVDIKDAPKKPANGSALSQEKLIAVLIAPHITEKTSLAMQNANTYSFRVRRDSTKPDIKAAVELMFGVKVANVSVVNETGKSRRFGKLQGRTQDIKKAYVRLAPGQTIDYEAKLKA